MKNVYSLARIVLISIGLLSSLICSYFVCLSVVRAFRPTGASPRKESEAAVRILSTSELNNALNWKPSSTSPLRSVQSAPPLKEWGTFRPGYYFGMKTKAARLPWSTGLLWSDINRRKVRHNAEQDEIAKFEWIRHDGENFGTQELVDNEHKIHMETSFLVFDRSNKSNNQSPIWMQKLTVRAIDNSNIQDVPIMWYYGIDAAAQSTDYFSFLHQNTIKDLSLVDELKEHGRLHLLGSNDYSGLFCITLHISAPFSEQRVSYTAKDQMDIHGLVEQLKSSPMNSKVYDSFGDLSNEVGEDGRGNVFALQFLALSDSTEIFISYYDHLEKSSGSVSSNRLFETSSLDVVKELWHSQYSHYLNQYEENFQSLYLTKSAYVNSLDNKDAVIEASKRCLSSLLGGIGYFEGTPRINHGIDIHPNNTEYSAVQPLDGSLTPHIISLFSATPSRSIFPRGFLWDEGFHQYVISTWHSAISLNSVQSWLNNLYTLPNSDEKDLIGWIPREMILGADGEKRVPGEFIPQRVNIANPPTFLLVLENILHQVQKPITCSSEKTCNRDDKMEGGLVEFLFDLYPRLTGWVRWFLITQQGADEGSFRWRGRSAQDRKHIPNTLASGLDDYPRGLFVHYEEKHVDLHCWMIKSLQVLNQIEDLLHSKHLTFRPFSHNGKTSKTLMQNLENKLEEYHWSEEYKGYFDTGLNNESTVFIPEVLFRCVNSETRQVIDGYIPVYYLQNQVKFCPASHPQPHSPIGDGNGGYVTRESVYAANFTVSHVARVGYTALFPVLLKLLPAGSPRLGAVLEMMEATTLLYSDYGLRSIATTDKFYQKKNSPHDPPYWRGPIWLNINYLALGALKHYSTVPGPHQQRIAALYTKLHKGIVQNVFKVYRETGFFWEQYNDQTGEGMRGHPFTGWTSTIVNILYEIY